MRSPRPVAPSLGAALLVLACGGDRRPADASARLASTMRGPDAVLLRIPRGGGPVRAVLYPRVDSVVWRSGEAAPALARVLDFDAEAGVLAAVDTGERPVRVDLRLGTARRASNARLTALAATRGTFYGVDSAGAVTRLTQAGGTWRIRLSPTPQALLPQRDGTVLAAGSHGGTGVLWVLRPPASRVADSVRVPGGARPVQLDGTDRVYFAGGDELLGVQARTLAASAPVPLGAALRAAAASPSGDRLYVLTERSGELLVVDRYAGAVRTTVRLPGAAREVRVDPLGRYLLVRPARGDSAWVVAAGTERLVGTVRGAWRPDLPAVLPDGAILAALGGDAAVIDGETLQPRSTVAGGAADFWHLVIWNGFRPRAAGLDQPARFERPARDDAPVPDTVVADDTADADSDTTAEPAAEPAAEPVRPGPPPRPTVPPPDGAHAAATAPSRPMRFAATGEVVATVVPVPTAPEPQDESGQGARASRATRRGWTVQFAAAPTEEEARRTLSRLRVSDVTLRVVPRTFDGRIVYRVVAGPFATRAEAERAARPAGPGNYWIYGGAP